MDACDVTDVAINDTVALGNGGAIAITSDAGGATTSAASLTRLAATHSYAAGNGGVLSWQPLQYSSLSLVEVTGVGIARVGGGLFIRTCGSPLTTLCVHGCRRGLTWAPKGGGWDKEGGKHMGHGLPPPPSHSSSPLQSTHTLVRAVPACAPLCVCVRTQTDRRPTLEA